MRAPPIEYSSLCWKLAGLNDFMNVLPFGEQHCFVKATVCFFRRIFMMLCKIIEPSLAGFGIEKLERLLF